MEKLVAELNAAGFRCSSVSELRTSGRSYREAVPILLYWLPRSTLSDRGEIVRALSVPWAKPLALPALVEQFRQEPAGDDEREAYRWSVGSSLEVIWDDQYFDELTDLIRDQRFGRARQMLVLGLRRSLRPEVPGLLVQLLDDETVNGHAAKALVTVRAPNARPKLEALLHDSRAWVRREASKALRALG